jgi:hypothetical protein
LFAALIAGCGDNIADSTLGFVGIPKDLKALSVNESTVRLLWSPPDGTADSVLLGYRITYLGREDSVPKTTPFYMASSLPAGDAEFTVYARTISGRRSDGASIRWAPAARFDNALVLQEFQASDLSRTCCLEVGSAFQDPGILSFSSPNARSFVDLYLWGEGTAVGQTSSPLELRSANLFTSAFNATLFSPVTHTATSLDYPLAEFPQEFSLPSVPVQDNTIYYLRVLGENGAVFFARVHVKVLGGTALDRTIAVRISLQRTPALPIAARLLPRRSVLAATMPGLGPR